VQPTAKALQDPNKPTQPNHQSQSHKGKEASARNQKKGYPVQENGSPKKFLANQKRWGSLERYRCRSGFLLFNVIFGGNGGKYFVYLLQKIQ
jgi:hypothetical protein